VLPAPFELHRPASVSEALELKDRFGEDAAFYAGGTELLIALKARVLRYAHIIDIKRLAELSGIGLLGEATIRVGALSTHRGIAGNALVRELFPAYAKLSDNVANIRVRAAGTLGGNLCFAEPHADPPTLLAAADAQLYLVSAAGERRLSMRDFVLGEFTTARGEGELLVAVEMPAFTGDSKAAYESFGSGERPAVGVAAVHRPGEDRPWRLWAGALCGRPTRLHATEESMNSARGESAADLVAACRESLSEEANALDAQDDIHGSAEYKRHLVGVLAERAIGTCIS
jgi:carbon-monoxide dehydrogenase medium subunit